MKYSVLYFLGIISLWRWFRRKKIAVLMLHGVMSAEEAKEWIPVRWQLAPKVLDRYLNCLVRNYEFISAADAVAMIQGTIPLRNNCAVVTIDDGYRNSYKQAWPVLQRHGITPIVFVATSLIDSGRYFWFDHLDGVLQHAAKTNKEIEFLGETLRIDEDDRQLVTETCKRIIRKSRSEYADDPARYKAIEQLVSDLGIPEDFVPEPKDAVDTWIGVLSENEIREADEEGLNFGSHTVSHARLPSISPAQRKTELTESKQHLEQIIGCECEFFCYPEGAIDAASAADVKAAGYRAAFAVHSNMPTRGSDLMSIGRIHFPKTANDAQLLAAVSGLSDYLQAKLSRIKSLFRPRATEGRTAGMQS